jgi:predicted RNA-binding protein with PUA-like domain
MLTLEAIKADPVLTEMTVCQRGTRLSITPVDPLHFKRACKLAGFR